MSRPFSPPLNKLTVSELIELSQSILDSSSIRDEDAKRMRAVYEELKQRYRELRNRKGRERDPDAS